MIGARAPGALIKRSVTIAGHATSISLEPVFWAALRAAAESEARTIVALVTEIDEARTTNLSSAIRVWLFERAQSGRQAADDQSTTL
jgi:predicted DNA-binding ribbon-helix-helix protein